RSMEPMLGLARSSIGSVVVGVVILASPRGAAACSCGPSGPPCQNAFLSDAVFAGTVRSITPLPDNGPPLRPGEFRLPETVRVEFEQVVAFRGVQGATVSVKTAGSGPACGYSFKQGERYLVYADPHRDGSGLRTTHCSRTRPLVEADEDLHFLQTLSTPHTAHGLIYGAVGHQEWDLATGGLREYGRVADVLVSVRGPRAAVDVWTDAQGYYEARVPPGAYEVSVFPPAGLSSRHQTYPIE